MSQDTAVGASNNQRLLYAARSDNEHLILEIFESGDFDINYQDGLGNTALHYAASEGSTDVIEHILSQDQCDVDPINRLDKATPLHLALKIGDPEQRRRIVESLLDAGADTSIRNKYGQNVLDLVSKDDEEVIKLIHKARADASISKDDIADDDDDDDDDGDSSGST